MIFKFVFLANFFSLSDAAATAATTKSGAAACTEIKTWNALKASVKKFKKAEAKTLTLCSFKLVKPSNQQPLVFSGRKNIIIRCELGGTCNLKADGGTRGLLAVKTNGVTLMDFSLRSSAVSKFPCIDVGGKKKKIRLVRITFESCTNFHPRKSGGAITVKKKATVYLNKCIFLGCSSASDGGAIYNMGEVYATAAEFVSCSTSGKGGAIYSTTGWLQIEGSKFITNSAEKSGDNVWSSDGGSIDSAPGNSACSDRSSACLGYIIGTDPSECFEFTNTGPGVDARCPAVSFPSGSPTVSDGGGPVPSQGPTVETSIYTPPQDASWSLLAWGWNNGGQDDVTSTLIVDVDHEVSAGEISQLRDDGHVVLCYFSAGTLEKWRTDYEDADAATRAKWNSLIIKKMGDWDEWWLDFTKPNLFVLKELMGARLQRMRDIGCQGVEPDNVDCYDNKRCVNKRNTSDLRRDQIAYNRWLADEAHRRGMFIALKNALDIVPDLVDDFDCAMNESCYHYKECGAYKPFIEKKKLVMNVEYKAQSPGWCDSRGAPELMSKWCDGNGNICKGDPWFNCR
mmetsp:Transcript_39071/g.76182  ORF Transcript_39071/g.76182 Transcript_39071/m.76182 type:complete len:568 (+) Transcript_39071:183-1886(+)